MQTHSTTDCRRGPRKPPLVCQHCGKEYRVKNRGRAGSKYCSPDCANMAHRQDPVKRFWERVRKSDAPNGCWEWTAGTNGVGYGELCVNGRKVLAHRYSYELHVGPISDGMFCLHNCPNGDNPRCVNPQHLWLGSGAENLQDMANKGRHWMQKCPVGAPRGDRNGSRTQSGMLKRGSEHPSAKVTEDDVRVIRATFSAGGVTKRELGLRFGLTAAAIYSIVTRRSWAHVPD